MKTSIALALLTVLVTVSASAGVADNDATCDIKVGPAATLLLPYFEVDPRPTTLAVTSSTRTSGPRYDPLINTADVGGWMYLNLNNGGSTGRSRNRTS